MAKLNPEHILLQELLRCPSVTPHEGGALDLLESRLTEAGFTCTRLPFGEGTARIDNLFAIWGEGGKHFGFAGHTDVVPAGDESAWQHAPFDGVADDDNIYGRGAVDMKGGIAAFITAALEWIEAGADSKTSRISLLITGDEEGDAIHGTCPMLEWVADQGLMADVFLVGEPTNPETLGDAIKHGRRGSLSGELLVKGKQGHAAYPHLADNPVPRLLKMLAPLANTILDKGNEHFDPSTVTITSIDTGNAAHNVIPSTVRARFNIRYTSDHTVEDLKQWLTNHFNSGGDNWEATWFHSAEPFITEPGAFTDILIGAVADITGKQPTLSTSGGTSDARFIAGYADVAEFGLVGRTMHQVDEYTTCADMTALKQIYRAVLTRFFGGP